MASPSLQHIENERKRLAEETGLRLSEQAAYWCSTNTLYEIPRSSIQAVDPIAVRQAMKQGLEYYTFEEGTDDYMLNLYKLGITVGVRTLRDYAKGETIAMLGPNAYIKGEVIDVAETFHMETQIFEDKELVWTPTGNIRDENSIGSYIMDCNSLGVGSPREANVDYHTAVFEFSVFKIAIPILVANQEIKAGEFVIGDFGESFFLEEKYMVPNLKALVKDSKNRKRKFDVMQDQALKLEQLKNTVYQELLTSKDEYAQLYKKFKPLQDETHHLKSEIATLEAQLRAEREAKDQLGIQVQELRHDMKILNGRLQNQFYTIKRIRQENESLKQHTVFRHLAP